MNTPDPSPSLAQAGGPVGASPSELDGSELEALRDREPEALQRFYETYFDRIYGYVRRLLRDEHLAEDLTQDIFMHIHRALPSYDPTRALRPWVFTIATNKLRDLWSSRRYQESRRQGLGEDGDDPRPEPAGVERGPRERLEAAELGAQVQAAVERLPETLRTTLVLRYYEGLSFAEIGRIVERTEVAVRQRYSRALRELRTVLEGLAEGGAEGRSA